MTEDYEQRVWNILPFIQVGLDLPSPDMSPNTVSHPSERCGVGRAYYIPENSNVSALLSDKFGRRSGFAEDYLYRTYP